MIESSRVCRSEAGTYARPAVDTTSVAFIDRDELFARHVTRQEPHQPTPSGLVAPCRTSLATPLRIEDLSIEKSRPLVGSAFLCSPCSRVVLSPFPSPTTIARKTPRPPANRPNPSALAARIVHTARLHTPSLGVKCWCARLACHVHLHVWGCRRRSAISRRAAFLAAAAA